MDGHASFCMANHISQFDQDLHLIKGDHKVDGIGSGINIKGIGTFKFDLEDDTGQVHLIRVPKLLYASLKQVLLAPHHWAQEAKDNSPTPKGTWMATYDDCAVLHSYQQQSKRTIPLNANTNTPTICTASSTKGYRAYLAVIEALKAQVPNHRREQVLLCPGYPPSLSDNNEFITKENLLLNKHHRSLVMEDALADDDTVRCSNRQPEVQDKAHAIEQTGPLSFDPNPDTEQDEHHHHISPDDQTELMTWHYCLGHLPFAKRLGKYPRT